MKKSMSIISIIIFCLFGSLAFAGEKRITAKTTLSLDNEEDTTYIASVPIEAKEKGINPTPVLRVGGNNSIYVIGNMDFHNYYPSDYKSNMSVVVVYESFDSETEMFVFSGSDKMIPWNFGEIIPKMSLRHCGGGGTAGDQSSSDCGYTRFAFKSLLPGVYKIYTALEGEVIETERKKVSNVTEYFYSGSFVLLPELKNDITDSIF